MDLNSTEFETDFSSAKKRLKNDQNDLSQSIELNEKRNFKEDPSDDDGNLTCFVEWCNTMGIFIDLNKVNQTMNYTCIALKCILNFLKYRLEYKILHCPKSPFSLFSEPLSSE